MIFKTLIFGCLACSAAGGTCQSPSASPSSATPPSTHEEMPIVFHSDLLDLSFTYPGSMRAKALPTPEQQHAATAKMQPADEIAAYKKADQCTDAALVAAREDDPDKSPVSIAIYGDKRGTVLTAGHAVKATIVISRVGLDCAPAEYQDRVDEMAGAMAELAIEESKQEQGLHAVDQPIWYEMGKTRIHFAAAEGDLPGNKAADNEGAPEHQLLASLAFVWKRNLISIVLTSNDLAFLNEMLHGKLALGDQAAAPLFSADLGHGTPIQPKP